MTPILAPQREGRSYILAGAFIAVALLVGGAWATIKMLQRPFYRNVLYCTYATDVTGLRVGTPVMVAGYKIGLVRGIDHHWQTPAEDSPTGCLDESSLPAHRDNPAQTKDSVSFRLTLAIDRDWQPRNKNSRVYFKSPNPLAGPVVMMDLGHGDPLQPRTAITFSDQESELDKVNEILEKARQIITSTKPFVDELAQAELPKTIADLLKRVDQTVNTLSDTAATLNQLTNDFANQDMAKIRAVLERTERASAQINTLLQEDTRQLLRQAQTASQTLNKTLTATGPRLSSAATDLEYTLQLTASRLPGLLNALENTIQELSGLTADLRSDPVTTLRGRGANAPVWSGEGK